MMFIEGPQNYQDHIDPRCGESLVIRFVPTFLAARRTDTESHDCDQRG
jgi:hypothetical protein